MTKDAALQDRLAELQAECAAAREWLAAQKAVNGAKKPSSSSEWVEYGKACRMRNEAMERYAKIVAPIKETRT